MTAQTPGTSRRNLTLYAAPIIIGRVEGPWRTVIRPDKLPKSGAVRSTGKGKYIVELPAGPFDYVIGYLVRIRVVEVLKDDGRARRNQIVDIFVPHSYEGNVSLTPAQSFLLALTPFTANKEIFGKASVIRSGQPVTTAGIPFSLQAHYYAVAGESNGAVLVNEKNRAVIDSIRAAIRQAH